MKIIINGKTYTVKTEDSKTLRDIEGILPVTLTMKRSHDVEFTGGLPVKPENDGRKISKIEPNGIYYYEGWNVLCMNYREGDISPYYITYLGEAEDPELSEYLKKADDTFTAVVEE